MYLLIGGDSELGVACYRRLRQSGQAVQATTRRRGEVSPERPFFNALHPLEDWKLPPDVDAACVFLAVARLRDCAADPVGSAEVNIAQTVRFIDKLTANGTYVLFLSSNQVFDGETANVSADASMCPVSEYGRQKAATEAAIRERIAQGAPLGILRLSKVLSPTWELVQGWIDALVRGKSVRAFDDMTVSPVPVNLCNTAITALLQRKLPGVYQLTGPRDVSYAEIGRHLARQFGVSPDLIEPISAYSAGMPEGSTPRHTTLDSTFFARQCDIVVPDAWDVLAPVLDIGRNRSANLPTTGAKLVAMGDLTEVAEGVFYSRYPLPLIDHEVIEHLKQVASTCQLRRARFCAHLSPDADQHDMLIVSHRDTYVTPHRHLTRSETFVVLEGIADLILFDENGAVEKTVKMGPPSSGYPFFYRMPAGQYHSMSIESELLLTVESTKGPFNLDDREHASWAPAFKDTENGQAFITSVLQKANKT
jgi:dTDP-4-dehydrorhamnose reductase